MCGITGYTGSADAVERLLAGLRALEYRGYDSAGIAVFTDGHFQAIKTKGRLSALEGRLEKCPVHSHCGIGHTRWATHGAPSDTNAHPHGTDHLFVVHNGIIENDREIKEELIAKGYTFRSETDTEAAAVLLDMLYTTAGDPMAAIRKMAGRLRGSYAMGIVFEDVPDTIYAVRQGNPLIAATGADGSMIASDIPAILKFSQSCYILEDGEIAVVRPQSIRFFGADGVEKTKTPEKIEWNIEAAERGGFEHFMLKEIHEEPEAVRRTLGRYVRDGLPRLGNLLSDEGTRRVRRLHIVACGTAMHAGLVGKWLIERLARIPTEVSIASEFRYADPVLDPDDLVVAISQSGETADTLAAVRLARARGVKVLAIVNVPGSSVARESDEALITCAGPEIAVASTKAYVVQLSMMYLAAIRLGISQGALTPDRARELIEEMQTALPDAIQAVIDQKERVRVAAKRFDEAENCFFIGRGLDCASAMEGSLKLKEITYIHSESYAAGELKHGAISLITQGMPVVALSTDAGLAEKMLSNIQAVRARGANVLLLCTRATESLRSAANEVVVLPDTEPLFTPVTAVVVMQLLAYYAAVRRGCDVDKPRNLAKSVTVE